MAAVKPSSNTAPVGLGREVGPCKYLGGDLTGLETLVGCKRGVCGGGDLERISFLVLISL